MSTQMSRAAGLALETARLGVSYGRTRALAEIDLALRPGERMALLGPNGAGKTTLLRALAGLVRPTSGSALVAGYAATSVEARRLVGVVSHQPYLYEELTASENLHLYARLYRVSGTQSRVDELLEQVGMWERRDQRVAALSRGMQQRLALARALVHDPPILLLDEPDTGLDLAAFQMLEVLLLRERTVLLATHNLQQGLLLAQRVALLVGGRLAFDAAATDFDLPALEAAYRGHLGRGDVPVSAATTGSRVAVGEGS